MLSNEQLARFIREEHEGTRRQFIFLMIAQTALLQGKIYRGAEDQSRILADMAAFPTELLPSSTADLHYWVRQWLQYMYDLESPPMNAKPPIWFQESWLPGGVEK